MELSVDTSNRLLAHYVMTTMTTQEALNGGSLKAGLPDVSNDGSAIREVNKALVVPWFVRARLGQELWLARRDRSTYGGLTLLWETIWKANVWSKYGSLEAPASQQTHNVNWKRTHCRTD